MAQHTLPVLSHPFFTGVFEASLNQQIRLVSAVIAPAVLTRCDYHTPESSWGACDGYDCNSTATVVNLEDGMEYCRRHFMEVARG